MRVPSSRHVLSGDIIEINLKAEDAEKMKLMLDLQWALTCLMAIAGAAGTPELLDTPDYPDDEFAVYRWLRTT